jgi:hypothetical protein
MKSDQDEFAYIVDSCLDMLLSGQATLDEILVRYPKYANELRSYLEAASWFKNFQQNFDASPHIKSSQKIRLGKAIRGNLPKAQKTATSRGILNNIFTFFNPKTFQLAGSIALVLVLLFSSSVGLAFAAKNSIPGDLLYPPKLSIEKAALFFSTSETQDTDLHIEYTNRRMDEMEAVIQTNRLGYLPESVERYQQQVEFAINKINSASFDSGLDRSRRATRLKVILETHTILINALATTIPDTYHDDLAQVASITQDSLNKATDIINLPPGVPATPGSPTDPWTPTTSLPAVSPTQPSKTPTSTPTKEASLTPSTTTTPLPLVLPGASPTPTPTPTITAPTRPAPPAVVPTRKPTKTPKIKPTRNPHYTPPGG